MRTSFRKSSKFTLVVEGVLEDAMYGLESTADFADVVPGIQLYIPLSTANGKKEDIKMMKKNMKTRKVNCERLMPNILMMPRPCVPIIMQAACRYCCGLFLIAKPTSWTPQLRIVRLNR